MTAAGDTFVIDPGASRFVAQAFATGMLSMLGHSPTIAIREYAGEARLDPEPALWVRIEAASLTVADRVSDKDRREMERTMFDQVLEVRRYRRIEYKSSRISIEGNRARVDGELTLRGVTRPLAFTANFGVEADSLRAHGDFTVLQSAWGIKLVRVAGGTLKLKDELKCSFDIVARRGAATVSGAA